MRRLFSGRPPRVEELERRDLLASYTTPEDTLLRVEDTAFLHAVIQARPLHGSVDLMNSGGFAYRPAQNYNGPDRFTYVIASTVSNVPTGELKEVSITVDAVNDAPVAEGNHYAAYRNTPLVIGPPGVLGNDRDVDSNALKAVDWTRPSHGELTPNENGDGGFRYVAAAGYTGEDSFTYKASDGTATSNEARVSILVKALPDARDDQVSVPQNTATTIAASTVLANDVPVTEFGLNVSLETGGEKDPQHGTVIEKKDDSGKVIGFVYTPASGYFGPDSFVYRATDATPTLSPSNSTTSPLPPAFDLARVWIYVRPVPSAVVANDDAFSTLVGKPLEIANPGVLKNDHVLFASPTDPATTNTPAPVLPNFPLTAKVVDGQGPKNGTLTLDALHGFVYKPNDGYVGTDTFVYVASLATTASGSVPGTNALSDTATVTITIHRLPDAIDDYYSVAQDTALTVTGKGVLANDVPVRPEFGLTATLEKKPEHGEVALDPTGSFVYKPKPGYSGPDKFVYRATDATPTATLVPGDSDTATVYIYVRPNPIVQANPDKYETHVNTALSVPLPGVLRNDYVLFVDSTTPGTSSSSVNNGNADGTPGTANNLLKAELRRLPANGRIELEANGSFKYVPNENFRGTDTFTYQAIYTPIGNPPADDTTTAAAATDSNVQRSDIATVTIHVNPWPLPIAHDDYYRVLEGTTLTVAAPGVLENDRAVNDRELRAVLNGNGIDGLEFKSDGSFTYAPPNGVTGLVSFSYFAIDRNDTPPSPQPGQESSTTIAGDLIFAPRPVNLAVVRIYVHPVHPHVYAQDDFYRTAFNTDLGVEAPGVLKNDTLYPPPTILGPSDVAAIGSPNLIFAPPPDDRVILKAELLNEPAPPDGLTFHTDGSFKYDPPDDFSGVVRFRYRATATIAVDPSDPSIDSLSMGSVNMIAPCYLDAAGTAFCPPLPDLDNIATVTIWVNQPEPPGPIARDDSYLTAANTTLGIRAPGVLANDSLRHLWPIPAEPVNSAATVAVHPPILPTLYAVLVEGPNPETEGVLTLESNGSFKFEPVADFVGDVKFTYQASLTPPWVDTPAEGDAPASDSIPILSNVATVTIRVAPALAHNDSYTTLRDVPLNVPTPGVLGNDDGESDQNKFTAVLMSGPVHGELSLKEDGSFNYAPDPNFAGADLFVYCVASTLGASCEEVDEVRAEGDANSATDPATGIFAPPHERRPNIAVVKINVRVPHSTVHAYPDRYPAVKDTELVVAAPGVLGNDFAIVNHDVIAVLGDRPGDEPEHGTVELQEDGRFVYKPDSGFVGEDRFIYKAVDLDAPSPTTNGTVNFSYATVVIHVLADSTLPRFLPGGNLRATDESGQQKVAEWASIVSIGGDGRPSFTVTTDKPQLFAAPPAIDAAGELTYTPAPNAKGQANVTVVLNDGSTAAAGASATFTIQIDKLRPGFNVVKPCDVTGDNDVAPDDVLTVVNYINSFGSSSVGGPEGEAGLPASDVDAALYYDVNGDGFIAPDDALTIINAINDGLSDAPEGEAASAIDASLLALIAEEAAAVTSGKRRV